MEGEEGQQEGGREARMEMDGGRGERERERERERGRERVSVSIKCVSVLRNANFCLLLVNNNHYVLSTFPCLSPTILL